MIHETITDDGKVHLQFSICVNGITVPFNLPLLQHMSLDQVEDVWADLLAALEDRNGYGGTVAEIYAYRLHRFRPGLLHRGTTLCDEAEEEVAHEAARNLHDVIEEFIRTHPCKVSIEDEPDQFKLFGPWVKDIIFCHREHVKVEKI